MKITIDVREDWLRDLHKAVGDGGSNDNEHELLMEIAEDVAAALPKPRPRYGFSVIELAGGDWHQGEILHEQLNTDPNWTAPELGDLIGNFLDEWIARCSSSTEDGETFPPALEINITRRDVIYALLTEQGTAAAETALCAVHLESHADEARAAADLNVDTTRFVDCTDNEVLACTVCGASK